MLEMLAQAGRPQPPLMDLIEKVARTPISTIVIFALVCTIIRVGINSQLWRRSKIERQMVSSKILSFLENTCDALIYAGVLVFLLIRPYAVQTFRIPTESMVPTLKVGDLLIVNKAIYRYSDPKVGDIVVFKPPAFAHQPGEDPNEDFVKRLVGVGGQVVEMKNKQLYRDGVPVSEPFVNPETTFAYQPADFKLVKYHDMLIPILRDANHNSPGHSLYDKYVQPQDMESVWDLPAQKIPDGEFLMMGDNRCGSYDGRFWGLIGRDALVGKAWLTFWPLNRMGWADKRPR
jgi:signal peptidase I